MRASTSSKVSRSIKYGRRRPGGASPRFARPLKSPSSRMRKGVSELGSTGRSLASASTSRVTEANEDLGMGVYGLATSATQASRVKKRSEEHTSELQSPCN